jgi:excisionase family DNA binding protein
MPKSINGRRYFSASEVAQMAGVHRLTLLRWIREGRMADVSRDRNGWRMFSEADAAQIADYASSLNERTSPAQTLLFHNLPVPNHG